MPYAFAHPAAVIPLPRLLGKVAVPSALVIGSIVPDAWYLLPYISRQDSHGAVGLLWFCLPVGLFAYAAFHLIFKQPLLALLPHAFAGRLRAFTSPALPAMPWHAVVASVAAGALTHVTWDALTHPGLLGYGIQAHRVLQHASTVFGTAFLAWWLWRKLRATPADASTAVPAMPATARVAIAATLLVILAGAFISVILAISPSAPLGTDEIRTVLRSAGVTALSTFGLAILAYCLLWRRRAAVRSY